MQLFVMFRPCFRQQRRASGGTAGCRVDFGPATHTRARFFVFLMSPLPPPPAGHQVRQAYPTPSGIHVDMSVSLGSIGCSWLLRFDACKDGRVTDRESGAKRHTHKAPHASIRHRRNGLASVARAKTISLPPPERSKVVMWSDRWCSSSELPLRGLCAPSRKRLFLSPRFLSRWVRFFALAKKTN